MKRALEGVKVGDTIKTDERYGSNFHLHTVARVTATQAICERESFMIASGVQVGSSTGGRWPTATYGELVPNEKVGDLRAAKEMRSRIARVKQALERGLAITPATIDAAEALIAAIEAQKQKKESNG